MTFVDTFLQYLETLPDLLVYFLLGLSAFVENIFPPIPGDTITAFGAFLVGLGRLQFFGVFLSTTVGSLTGFMTLFQLGKILGRTFFTRKDFRFLRSRDILKAESWFNRYGYLLVAANRFLPGIRSAIAVAGGITRLKTMPVILLAAISCGVWNFIWILAGFSLGSEWEVAKERILHFTTRYNLGILLALTLVVLFLLVRRVMRKRKEKASHSPPPRPS
ncbi:MAG: DedA family protein [Deltaproteobacteria bacterium]|nr:DedA family protein [Deltaproteobacteria bacterium]MBW2017916.1 DedA family protein [Deltaproteobacteria bacterium]MBW2128298.1 DedA family protein [Deltaproteobacteria bacterium]MBW2303558.1 DedA family protein [Deltaproteobacteria bacterium]